MYGEPSVWIDQGRSFLNEAGASSDQCLIYGRDREITPEVQAALDKRDQTQRQFGPVLDTSKIGFQR